MDARARPAPGRADMESKWLEWARRLQALSQSGLAYTNSPFEIERYEEARSIAAQMMASLTEGDPAPLAALFAEEKGYATPKVDVRGVVFRDGKLLLVREKRDGLWTLPGGWADVGDTPRQAVEREIAEESGYTARATKLLAVWDRRKHGHPVPATFHLYKLFIQCELTGGAPMDSIETDGASFFSEDAIPPLSSPRVTPGQISRLFEHMRHPEWPADFD